MAQQSPPPGWYPDPAGGWGQRYWDGEAWGPVAPPPAQPPPAPPRRSGVLPAFLAGLSPALLIVLLPLVCCGACGVFGLIAASDHGTSRNNQSTTTTAEASAAAPPTTTDKRSDYLSTLRSEGIQVDDQTRQSTALPKTAT